MEPFATVEDYRIRYPADATVSTERIEAALADAQDMIEVEADDLADVAHSTLVRLTCLAASRAIRSQESGMDGLGSLQRTAGPYSVMVRPASPSGGCYLLDREWAQIGVGVARMGTMSMIASGGE